jgi:lipopolysaccharide export system permease protein
VFFIEKSSSGSSIGNNVFIATHEPTKETVTSAQSGRVEAVGADRFLVLQNGQRLEKSTQKSDLMVSFFETYGARVGADDPSARSYVPTNSIGTMTLLQNPSKPHWAELSWRAGLTLAAINFVLLGLATAGVNPRVGRSANMVFAFMTFVVYFNLLGLGKNWIQNGQVHFAVFLVALHGGALLMGVLLLAKRHNNWEIRLTPRAKPLTPEALK